MQVQEYLSLLYKRWWIILLVGIVTAASAYVFSKLQNPVFSSSAKLYVMPARPDYGNALFSQAVVMQYSQLLVSDRFLKSVSENLKLDLPVDSLRQKVASIGKSEDLVIRLEVKDTDPGRARAIARQMALDFIHDQNSRMKEIDKDNRIDVMMYDEPSAPVLAAPRTKLNVITGGFLGILVGVAIAFFLEYLDDTIKGTEDVDRYVALPVVGNIPTFQS